MEITILLFGELAQIAGTNALAMNAMPDTDSLKEKIHQHYPSFEKKKYVIAINKQLIKGKQELNENDEIALLPPFAGG
ncbi:MAG: MoaD/ThiS family protein [Bacteroidota bacterium]|nr:MoaD/ThiS family protein [Bacteroidota bacterium]